MNEGLGKGASAAGVGTGALKGIRVLDLTSVLLGPTATQILGDLGADVIKIESPSGDTTRSLGACRESGMAYIFLHVNRNKRSLVLDLKTEGGKKALRRLIETADVFMHNMRAHALAALGFDYESVAAINPRIVYCGAFGFGQTGPYARYPAYDDLIQGAVGIPSLLKQSTGQSSYVPAGWIDRTVALAATYSVCAALFHRERTGQGQSIEVPMFETMANLILGEHMGGATFDPPAGPVGNSRMLSKHRRPYRTSDGYVATVIYTDRHWQRFFSFVGRSELVSDVRFATLAARTRNIDAVYDIAEGEFLKRPSAEWISALRELDIPVTAVPDLESLMDDPHLAQVGLFSWVEHPTQGRIGQIGLGSTWSATPPTMRRQAPRIGEHSREILAEIGYSPDDIEKLLSSSKSPTGHA